MTLNATFIVQVIHFGVIWLIINYLLIKPAIRVRDAIKNKINAVTAERDTLKGEVGRLRDAQYSLWNNWQLQARQMMRTHHQPIENREPIIIRTVFPEAPAHEIEQVIDRLTSTLINRMRNIV
jgi:hypothetical protein